MSNRYAIILGAGKGTRMKSKLYKVLHPVCGKPMIQHVVDQLTPLNFNSIVTILGFGGEAVKNQLGEQSDYAVQDEQLGTAHAVQQAAPLLEGAEGTTVILCGDTPLITGSTIKKLLAFHEQNGTSVTVLTALLNDPTGYGRIIRGSDGDVIEIVEHKDATDEQKKINEISTGIFCFDNKKLFEALKQVNNDNVQEEYYLPDALGILKNAGEKVSGFVADAHEETLGVNDRSALSEAEKIMKVRINDHHMKEGVTIIDPDNTYISADTVIGSDTVIYPGTMLNGKVRIGEDCEIGPNTEIKNSTIENGTTIRQSVVHDSVVGNQVAVGPFAHIRPLSEIQDKVKIGNFVEVKKSTMAEGSKASHLSYIGDAEIGKEVNLGCGSITVNYDGVNKYLTKVEDGAFIGCNVNLVAPVTVGKNAFVAAGSTVTDNVNANALSIARARQVNKENYIDQMNLKKNN